MKKKYIVKKSLSFEKIISAGSKVKNQYFVIYFFKNNLKYSRFGISVGKKIGNAVCRNKHKRKIRAIIDNNKNYCLNGTDYIIILREAGKDKDYNDLSQKLLFLLNKIREE